MTLLKSIRKTPRAASGQGSPDPVAAATRPVVDALERRVLLSTATLAAAADAYVRSGTYGNENFGTVDRLYVKQNALPAGSTTTNFTRESHLRFDLSGLASMPAVGTAKLRLWGKATDATQQINVAGYSSSNTAWVEGNGGTDGNPVGEITWNNTRADVTTVLDSELVPYNNNLDKWHEWDVGSYLAGRRAAGATSVTLVLKAPGVTDSVLASFFSREHADAAHRPQLVVTSAGAYPDAVRADAPVAHYRLSESSPATTAFDATAGGRHGTYAATGATLGAAGALAGDADAAVTFNGSSGQVSVPHNAAFNVTSAATLEAWFKTGYGGDQYLTSKGEDSWYFAMNGGALHVNLRGPSDAGGWLSTPYAPAYNDNAWHHAAATYDGSQITVYVDGRATASRAASGSIYTGGDAVDIGSRNGTSNTRWNGQLDEVAIYNVGLSAARVNAHYEAGGGTATPATVTATAASATTVNVAWADLSGKETGYEVQRATDAAFTAGVTTFAATAANATTYADATAAASTAYYYRVRTRTAAGASAWSSSASAVTPTPTPTPTPTNTPPTIIANAAVADGPVIYKTAHLGVLAHDDGGAGNLTYTWATTGSPPAAVIFLGAVNGTTEAAGIDVRFAKAGTYQFQVNVSDGGSSVSSNVTVNVLQRLARIDAPDTLYVSDGQNKQFTATSFDQFDQPMTVPPTFAWSLANGTGSLSPTGYYTSPPDPQWPSGTVSVSAGALTEKSKINSAHTYGVDLVAHRTGMKWGEEIDDGTEDAGDATEFLVLTNNDFEEPVNPADPNDTGRDHEDVKATTDGSDDDLVKLTLRRMPSFPSSGTIDLRLLDGPGDASAGSPNVRLFKADGTLLYDQTTGDAPLRLTIPPPNSDGTPAPLPSNSYLAGIKNGDLTIWLEGLAKVPDLTVSHVYTDPQGYQTNQDDVHINVAEWTFRNNDGDNVGNLRTASYDDMLDVISSDPNVDRSFADVKVRFNVEGVTANDISSVRVSSLTVPTDRVDLAASELTVDPATSAVTSEQFVVGYASGTLGHLLSPSQRDQVRQAADIIPLHNDGVLMVMQAAKDAQKRKVVTAWVLDPVHANPRLEPAPNMPNPAAIVKLAAGEAPNGDNVAHVRLTEVPDAFNVPPIGNDDELIYWIVKPGSVGDVAFYTPPGKPVDDTGRLVRLYGTRAGRVTLEVRKKFRKDLPRAIENSQVIETYEAVVVDLKQIKYRAQLLKDPGGADPRFTAQDVKGHIRRANYLLRQIGVELVPDTQGAEDGAVATAEPGIFTATTHAARATFGVDRSYIPGTQNIDRTKGMDRLLQINNRPGVLQIIYVNDVYDPDRMTTSSGFMASFPAVTENAANPFKRVTYRYDANRIIRKHVVHYKRSGVNGGDGNQNWGLFMSSADEAVDPRDPNGLKTVKLFPQRDRTLAHEAGHYFGIMHRGIGPGHDQKVDPVPPKDPFGPVNVMTLLHSDTDVDNVTDFDLSQVYIAHRLPDDP